MQIINDSWYKKMDDFLKLFDFQASFDSFHLKIVLILTVGFALASLLGYWAWRIKLSPIIGYLAAGFLIGPYSPGFVADARIAEQLSEIGVILMMFSVGLHFKLKDLLNVKNIAIPGAVIQTLFATVCSTLVIHLFGWPWSMGIILGLSIGVASTVVLLRMLTDHHLLKAKEGHIAVGWLIVEDIITVVILIALPSIASFVNASNFSWTGLWTSLGAMIIKFVLLGIIMLMLGQKFVTYALSKVVRTQSHELFTLFLLALTFVLATGSAILFGISIALGAFLAGMVIGQTGMRDLALVNSLPMKDAFIAIFFISVGMLFNPDAIFSNFPLFISILAIILLLKPLTAFLISMAFKYPFRTSLIVAAALAQIGEFSFILTEEAKKLNLMTEEGYDIIVACAIVSITVNSLIFKQFRRIKNV